MSALSDSSRPFSSSLYMFDATPRYGTTRRMSCAGSAAASEREQGDGRNLLHFHFIPFCISGASKVMYARGRPLASRQPLTMPPRGLTVGRGCGL